MKIILNLEFGYFSSRWCRGGCVQGVVHGALAG